MLISVDFDTIVAAGRSIPRFVRSSQFLPLFPAKGFGRVGGIVQIALK